MMPTVADYRTSNLLILRAPATEKVPVTQEVAGSSPVAPANYLADNMRPD